ncbi:argonaute/piwi family protein [Haloarcula sebkhae]|uniref:Uncharacterized protein n=2 Tax=Haloarcula sebkhae TaxID=932660 RepID=A0ACC6VNP1_9EURY|nr:hypothetical protein [Haloarcula sebkhae]GGK83428.1 hypothetical protein GCM10009067_39580 [Haloarcula sebkhae]
MDFETEYIEEPSLKFKSGEAKDPRAGLMEFGPWTPGSSGHNEIKIGLIGTNRSISAVKGLLQEMETVIPRNSEEVKRHQPPFPSMGPNSPFEASFVLMDRHQSEFTRRDLDHITQHDSPSENVGILLDQMDKRLQILKRRNDPPPDVVIVAIPEEIEDACTRSGVNKAKMKDGPTDFHDRIKTFGLKYDVPTQLIRPASVHFDGTGQSKAEVAWNLSVGLLYKSREGKPWKVADLAEDTCYAGISFYRERHGDRSKAHASLAQVFLDTGESFVVWGDPAIKDDSKSNYHLTKDSAEDIVTQILDQYTMSKPRPERLVLHKTSRFHDEEKEGFLNAASDIPKLDFVTIREGDGIRLFPSGDYPPLRGTVLHPRNTSKYFLYTQGYVPSLETYPGPRIPTPITVELDPDVNHTSHKEICREILSFTKLDWNTSSFCKKQPVTIKVARSVGAILAESKNRGIDVQPQYYYYM